MPEVQHFYRKVSPDYEYCFNVQTSSPLDAEELKALRWLLAETFDAEGFSEKSSFNLNSDIVEIGPLVSLETAYSTNAVAICHACGIDKIERIECSRRYIVPAEKEKEQFCDF